MNVILFMSLIVNLKYTYLIFTATNKQRLKNSQTLKTLSTTLKRHSLHSQNTLNDHGCSPQVPQSASGRI